MFKNSMHAAQGGPAILRLVGESIRIMRLTHVQQVKGWAFLRVLHLAQDRLEVVVIRHQLVAVKSGIQNRMRIQHRQGYASVCAVSELLLEKRREVQRWDQRLEFDTTAAQPLV